MAEDGEVGMRRRLVLAAVVAVATLASTAGCVKLHVDPIVNTVPTTDVSGPYPEASATSLPPATHKWKVQSSLAACPTLSATSAASVGVPTTGKVVHKIAGNANGGSIECQWGPEGATGATVTMTLNVSNDPTVMDEGFKNWTGLLPEQVNGVGEAAFMQKAIPGLAQWIVVRTGNALLQIKIEPFSSLKDDMATVQKVHDSAPEIAKDMVSALVPA